MRMISKNLCVNRPSDQYGLYRMSNHKLSQENPNRNKLLFSSIKRMKNDGLNNIKKLNLKVNRVINYALYTKLEIYV